MEQKWFSKQEAESKMGRAIRSLGELPGVPNGTPGRVASLTMAASRMVPASGAFRRSRASAWNGTGMVALLDRNWLKSTVFTSCRSPKLSLIKNDRIAALFSIVETWPSSPQVLLPSIEFQCGWPDQSNDSPDESSFEKNKAT